MMPLRVRSRCGVPMNPTRHLHRVLQDDQKYVASILRAPMDLGDPADCKHTDIENDEKELRKVALRLNHRRISLMQLQHWIDHASGEYKHTEQQIKSTTDTARNLAEQLDSLNAQRDDIANHVRRSIQLKELDRQSAGLMRLKEVRVAEEVALQTKHNAFAIRNNEINGVMAKLHDMRTKKGLALGKLADPKPYRFAQAGLEAADAVAAEAGQAAQAASQAEAEAQGGAEDEAGAESEADTTSSEAAAESSEEASE